MIYIDYKISKSILKKVNKNIYLILELFTENCKDLDYETFIIDIFPEFLCRENPEKCIKVIEELKEYSKDEYYHRLTPIYERALFYLFEWWLEVSVVEFDESVVDFEIKTEDDKYIAERINDIEEYKEFMFDDWDFLDNSLTQYYELYIQCPDMLDKVFHIDLSEYLELFPKDIRENLINDNSKNKKDCLIESLIIKSIHNAIKYRENNPKRLMDTTETQLSDDIRDIISENLYKNGVIITREMPKGFANKGIGECDFYLYTYENGIFKIIAIGENKEWGKYQSQMMQLIGYMNVDTSFGFTILFNKSVKLKTALSKRVELLKNFVVNIDGKEEFKVEGEIQEVKGMEDVLITLHKNPEKDNSYFRMYHFIINAVLPEREETAKQARA